MQHIHRKIHRDFQLICNSNFIRNLLIYFRLVREIHDQLQYWLNDEDKVEYNDGVFEGVERYVQCADI